jgi:redox-sensitive bicupin YhaK (pirin superfamily)
MPMRASTPACSTAPKRPALALDPKRKSYVHLVRGELDRQRPEAHRGDAAMLEAEPQITVADGKDAEVLVFDLAA